MINHAAIQKADSQLEALTEGFVEWALSEVTRAQIALQTVSGDEASLRSAIDLAFDVLHNLKGQGGTFHYDLVTGIAGVGCEILRGRASVDADELQAVIDCCEVIQVTLKCRFVGDGGEKGRHLLSRLSRISDRAKVKHPI